MTEEQTKIWKKVLKGLEEEITECKKVLKFFQFDQQTLSALYAEQAATYATVTTKYPSAVGLFAGPPIMDYDHDLVKNLLRKAEQVLSEMIKKHRCRLNPSF